MSALSRTGWVDDRFIPDDGNISGVALPPSESGGTAVDEPEEDLDLSSSAGVGPKGSIGDLGGAILLSLLAKPEAIVVLFEIPKPSPLLLPSPSAADHRLPLSSV